MTELKVLLGLLVVFHHLGYLELSTHDNEQVAHTLSLFKEESALCYDLLLQAVDNFG